MSLYSGSGDTWRGTRTYWIPCVSIPYGRSSLPQTETISIQILSTPVATLPARNHSQSCRNGEKHAFCDTQLRLVNHGSQRFRVRCNHSGRAGEVAIKSAPVVQVPQEKHTPIHK